MTPPPLGEVAADLREEAEDLRRWGANEQAEALDRAADEVDDALRRWWQEELNLKQAAQEEGCSYSKMQSMVSRGEVANAGRKNRPRVRRCDLPRHRDHPVTLEAS